MGLSLGLDIGFCCLGIEFGFESVALVVGGVIRLLSGGGGWCAVRWVVRQWLWMAKREMEGTNFFFLRKGKRLKLEREER